MEARWHVEMSYPRIWINTNQSVYAGLSSQQWERKKAAAKSVQRLCEDGADALGSSAATICAALLQVRHLEALLLPSVQVYMQGRLEEASAGICGDS